MANDRAAKKCVVFVRGIVDAKYAAINLTIIRDRPRPYRAAEERAYRLAMAEAREPHAAMPGRAKSLPLLRMFVFKKTFMK